MTRDELLAIGRPEDLYPGDPIEAKHAYRLLSQYWHPDRPTGEAQVFVHISKLYREALHRLAEGRWEGATTLHLVDTLGTTHVLDVQASSPCLFGQSLVGPNHFTYLIQPAYIQEMERASRIAATFKFVTAMMREEIARYLPATPQVVALEDGRWLYYVAKTPDLLRLRDVVTHVGTLDAKHVAWIVSSMLNLCCYLSFTKLVHQDISLDSYFISPTFHSGALLGGWWWTHAIGAAITKVPRRTLDVMPFKVRLAKQAHPLTDLELVRATAREIPSNLPEPMRTWLHTPGSGPALAQYEDWMEVLHKTFGPRKFIPLPITGDAVYGKARITN